MALGSPEEIFFLCQGRRKVVMVMWARSMLGWCMQRREKAWQSLEDVCKRMECDGKKG